MTKYALYAPTFLSFLLVVAFMSPAEPVYAEEQERQGRGIFGFLFGRDRDESPVTSGLLKAVEIAERRAHSRSTRRCWRYVKLALLEANVVEEYPGTVYAKQAGRELMQNHGFIKLEGLNCPFEAPVGSVLVYGGRGPGHVEFRTKNGFVSDFRSERPSRRPLVGVYVKGSG